MKKILLSTSGSGGHTVPVKWIVKAIRKLDEDVELSFIGSKDDKTVKVLRDEFDHDKLHLVNTGKYRRYATQSKLEKIADWQTNSKNIADLFRFVRGLRASYRLLKKINPDLVFIKGGSVALPVGLAANYLKIPLITHDSDTIPGMSNKIAGKKAVLNLVASEQGNYPYEKDNIRVVGVPVSARVVKPTKEQQSKAKLKLGFDSSKPLVLVTGGSLGAVMLNRALRSIGSKLTNDGIQILHQCGEKHYDSYKDIKDWQVRPFLIPEDMTTAFTAMDLVVARSSATTTHEVSAAHKPLISIPAPQLYDQVSNAKHLSSSGAVIMLTDDELESSPERLYDEITKLISDPDTASSLAKELNKLYNPRAAEEIAELIIGMVNEKS